MYLLPYANKPIQGLVQKLLTRFFNIGHVLYRSPQYHYRYCRYIFFRFINFLEIIDSHPLCQMLVGYRKY